MMQTALARNYNDDASAEDHTTSNPSVGTLIEGRSIIHMPPLTTVRQACEIMAMLTMGALPIVSEEKLIGIFTERDAVTAVLAKGRDPDDTFLSEVMTSHVVTVDPSVGSDEARAIMVKRGFRHLPVVRDGEILGILSLRDVIK